jgi:hypothetical protein
MEMLWLYIIERAESVRRLEYGLALSVHDGKL